jgi:hypothetical protein
MRVASFQAQLPLCLGWHNKAHASSARETSQPHGCSARLLIAACTPAGMNLSVVSSAGHEIRVNTGLWIFNSTPTSLTCQPDLPAVFYWRMT